ncbi:hypothetical protein U1Q18_000525 [Sarracenia purpurea var. burkii]
MVGTTRWVPEKGGRESNIGETISETVVDCPEGDKAILDFPSLPRRLNISGENGTVSERASLIPNQSERESESPDSSHSEVEESSPSAAEVGASMRSSGERTRTNGRAVAERARRERSNRAKMKFTVRRRIFSKSCENQGTVRGGRGQRSTEAERG